MNKAKIVVFTITSCIFFASCQKSKTQETIDKFISESFSEIEQKDVNVVKFEMSDRDAFEEVKKYYYNIMQSEIQERDNNLNPKTAEIYNVVIENALNQQQKLLDSLSKSTGKRLFTRAIITRTNPDTISHSILYIDGNGNISLKRLIK